MKKRPTSLSLSNISFFFFPIDKNPHRLADDGERAGNGTRTRDINLGKVALYQLSYSRASLQKVTETDQQ